MVNVIISQYEQPDMGDCTLAPQRGNVAFGSGKDCWAFTLTRFARIYANKFKIEQSKMMERLWGDNYFDSKAKKWKNYNTADSGETLPRAFCTFIMDPIVKLSRAVIEGNDE